MEYEKSCGAIVYRRSKRGREALLIHQNAGHWGFPKGHVEEGEAEEETALREIREETGLAVSIVPGFRRVHRYSPREGVDKDAVFFVARAGEGADAVPQFEEVSELRWLPFEEVADLLTFDDDRALFEAACEFIESQPD